MNPINRIGPVKPPPGGLAGVRRRQRPEQESKDDEHKQPEGDSQGRDQDDAEPRHRIDELA